MDNFNNALTQPFQIIQNDEFLDMLNESGQHPVQQQHNNPFFPTEDYEIHNYLSDPRGEKQWMFGTTHFEMKFEESPPDINPFYESNPQPQQLISRDLRSESYFGNSLLELAPSPPAPARRDKKPSQIKEQEIILNNKELFKANQSKSIYLSKISTLIDRNVSPTSNNGQPLSPNTAVKIQEKIARKTSGGGGRQDSDSSSDMKDPNQMKLAKNRESARNSRKRKKVYVELLENKVAELTEQLQRLDATCNHQKAYIEHCQNINQKVYALFQSEQALIDDLGNAMKYNQPLEPILNMMEYQVGPASEMRNGACEFFFNGLIQCILTNHSKLLCEQAEKNEGLFTQSLTEEIHAIQQDMINEYAIMKENIELAHRQVQELRRSSCKLGQIEKHLASLTGQSTYVKHMLEGNQIIKIENQMDRDIQIKIEDNGDAIYKKKQVKTF